jgi:hypothetical protein
MAPRSLKIVAAEMVAKMECLWKPAQSGKTRTIQDIIRKEKGVQEHLNIIICSKNRLLVSQLEKRMNDDLYAVIDDEEVGSVQTEETIADDVVVGGVYSWMSGTKRTNISVRDLAWRISRNEVSMVVCCSHKARFQYLRALLNELETSPFFKKPVNVWIDEADASVKLWTKSEFDFVKYDCVRKVTLVSATFDEVFKFYDRIRVKAFPETHPECYRGLKDCRIEVEKNGMSPAAYLASVLEKHPELAQPRSRLFAPGAVTVDSHNEVADVLTHYGFAFLILNGKEKAFWLPDGTRHPVELSADGDELSRILAEKYAELGLERYPFAVTGHLCLSRGITFQSRDFLFDYGVLPNIPDAASAYQCVARVLGNVASFSDIKPVIYMSEEMKVATTRQERIAVNLARLVHEHEWASVGLEEVERASYDKEEDYLAAKVASKDKFADDEFECTWGKDGTEIFNTLEEAKAAGWGKKGGLGKDDRGFYNNRYNAKSGIPMTREEYEIVRNGKKAMLARPRGNEESQVNIVFYEDITDLTTARFAFKWVKRKVPVPDPGAVGPTAAGGVDA